MTRHAAVCTDVNAHFHAALHARSMSGYTLQCGHARESTGMSGQQFNVRGHAAWFDFGACPVSTDAEGYCVVQGAGMRHVAVRTCGRESQYKPAVRRCARLMRSAAAHARPAQVSNIAPRPKDWKPAAEKKSAQ